MVSKGASSGDSKALRKKNVVGLFEIHFLVLWWTDEGRNDSWVEVIAQVF